jgi:phage FluMu protein Com
MPYEMRALDPLILEVGQFVSLAIQNRHSRIARPIIFRSTRISAIIRRSFANSRSFVYRLNETMFFDNLPLEITCPKCGKQINETVRWLKADSRKCPFCDMLFDTTEFRRGIDEATNRTHEMLRNLQESLGSIKIKLSSNHHSPAAPTPADFIRHK